MKKLFFVAGLVVNIWMVTTLYHPTSGPFNNSYTRTMLPLIHAFAIAICVLGISDVEDKRPRHNSR
jgi:hypothetical protein